MRDKKTPRVQEYNNLNAKHTEGFNRLEAEVQDLQDSVLEKTQTEKQKERKKKNFNK